LDDYFCVPSKLGAPSFLFFAPGPHVNPTHYLGLGSNRFHVFALRMNKLAQKKTPSLRAHAPRDAEPANLRETLIVPRRNELPLL
jgi:hypothetical protein